MSQRPDVAAITASLKPFQQDTVAHVFARLWTDADAVDRFLVADEVGLGKTMIAKGVAARAIDHLWEQSDDPITIVYICSNQQIAQQNLAKLAQLTGGTIQTSADRLTMLPLTMEHSDAQRVQLVAFTPGTSLKFGTSAGKVEERVLLHRMLASVFPGIDFSRRSWLTLFAGRASVTRFQDLVARDRFQRKIPPSITQAFFSYIQQAKGPGGGRLVRELFDHHARWNRHAAPVDVMQRQTSRLIARFRTAMATASVGLLTPDLVILDEFQRFKELFADDEPDQRDQAQHLAQQVINSGGAKTLVLSATPYKMYTVSDDPAGEEHYADFTSTIAFLAGTDKARKITRGLTTMREAIMTGTSESVARAETARAAAEDELTRVMSRTERLAATTDRSGMLVTKTFNDLRLGIDDVRGWRAIDDLYQTMRVPGAFEYWRSAPYTINLMDRGYQAPEKLFDALQADDPDVTATLAQHEQALLSWSDIRQYKAIDPANAKLRALTTDVMKSGAWRLAWISPSLPYLEPGGVYAHPEAQRFTKRLIFSAWNIVPKTIAALLSYEAERQAVEHNPWLADAERNYPIRITPPLTFAWDTTHGLPQRLTNLTVLYPSVTLARLGDPITVARELNDSLPLHRETYFAHVKQHIEAALERAGIHPQPGAEGLRRRWYGVAPFLLDKMTAHEEGWNPFVPDEAWSSGDTSTRLVDHARWARFPNFDELGAPPEDLAEVLTLMAAAAPGVCALRAVTRNATHDAMTKPDIRAAALKAASGLRNLVNRPTIVSIIRGAVASDDAESYWRQVLTYCLDGNLQAVLDEYCHMLTGSAERDATDLERAQRLAAMLYETTSIRTAQNAVYDIQVHNGHATATTEHINAHIAARFGREQSSDEAAQRESTVRESFNSPFWPFVLASTSVGQEGLDFHTYSHAVVHWNLPSNPVDLEQREGRVHRYKGHAVRKNVAAEYGQAALDNTKPDPWDRIFAAAEAERPAGDALLDPYWVKPGTAHIERYVTALPLSTEQRRLESLVRSVGAYRFVLGQPRQEELIRYLGEHAQGLQIDLSPPRRS